uniref:Pectinesterase inhibitor domain-containing protein n=1 Tax=Kalanchoe fedtschenkoi TaxID=63787 RepID=A0A7N0V2J2_KALFE
MGSDIFAISLFTVVVLSMVAASSSSGTASTEFIRTSCASTTYPALCYTSLVNHASVIQKSPKLLARTALSVAATSAKTTSTAMLRLSRTRGLKPREIGAMKDCLEEMADSAEQIQKSLTEMRSFKESDDFRTMISDVQTWVSAALTSQDTCSEGFAGKEMDGNVKIAVTGNILKIVHLTSNALALINNYASVHG